MCADEGGNHVRSSPKEPLPHANKHQLIFYPETHYGGYTDIDGTVVFYNRVNALIHTRSIVLDVGCGVGSYSRDSVSTRRNLRILKGKCAKVIGIDVDESAKSNPYLDESKVIDPNQEWPVDSQSIDVCICDNVLEHIAGPSIFFTECNRVIKKGGYLCIRTPNVLSYFGFISKIVPEKFAHKVISVAQGGNRLKQDIFPTFYRCNTVRKIKSMLSKYGFESCVYGYEAEPAYLSFSRAFYFLGYLHQRFAPRAFKVAIFAFAKKK